MSSDYVCERCGHDGEEHTPEIDDDEGFINCRYECNHAGCDCQMFRVRVA